jgi:YidC/Oxa1 family membrane protein insertase
MRLVLCFIYFGSVISFAPNGLRRINLKNSLTLNAVGELHDIGLQVGSLHEQVSNTWAMHGSSILTAAEEAVSQYSKVDKTGFIGGIANVIENGIDLAHNGLMKIGMQNTYGISICLFTLLIKMITLPLTTSQLESTAKMQQLTPLQQKITAAFPNPEQEQQKNQLISQLFQAAQVNPLAGCFPALVQIPVFISLYRALQNLIAEDKLSEPFLWIPNLEGPVYRAPPGETLDWVKSIFSGEPLLGWDNTLAFLSLPVILFISQSVSQKLLKPPEDPNRVKTDQELTTQGVLNNLPFIIAFFSLNVPAGLGVYWVVNNILTTLITVSVKSGIKEEELPREVVEIMAMIERGNTPAAAPTPAASRLEFGQDLRQPIRPKAGFSSDKSNVVPTAEVVGSTDSAQGDVVDAEFTPVPMEKSGDTDILTVPAVDDNTATPTDDVAANQSRTPKKRKKRVKTAKKGKKKG